MRALLITVGVGLLAATPAYAQAPLCDARQGETVAATDVVRVFRDGGILRGCRHGSRRTLRLGVRGACGHLGAIAAAGRYVAVTRLSCADGGQTATVVLFDLHTLRDVIGASAYAGETPRRSTVSVVELALSRAGALAWISRRDGVTARSELHLRRAASSVPEHLASSEPLGLSDLAVTARKLYWHQDGKAQVIDL